MTPKQIKELQIKADALACRLRATGDSEGADLVHELRRAAYRGWNMLDQLSKIAERGIDRIGD